MRSSKDFCHFSHEELLKLKEKSEKNKNNYYVLAISHIRSNCPDKFETIVGYPDRKPHKKE